MNVAATPRIGYVVNEFPQPGDDRLLNEVLELERCGVELSIFALRRADHRLQSAKADRLQARVSYLPTRAHVRERATWIASQVRNIEHLHAYSAQQSADITRDISALTSIPYSFSVEATDLGAGGVKRRDLRARAAMAQFIITRSAASVALIGDLCDDDALQKCHCLYHGIDLAEMPSINQLRPANAVLAIAGPSGNDGVSDILQAVAILRRRDVQMELTIVAPEESHAAIQLEIGLRSLQDLVQVTALAEPAEMLTLMRKHTLLVAPWRATSEPADIPEVLLHGMALGLPVIASDLPGVRDAVEDGWSGRLIPAGDATWLAGAVETILQNGRLRQRMARCGRQFLERDFSLSRNGSVLARLFAYTAGERRWTARAAAAAATATPANTITTPGNSKGNELWVS